MLRNIFVASIIAFGFASSLWGPFNAMLFYLWIAYFRPDGWLHTNWVTSLNLSFVVGTLTLLLSLVRFDDLRPRLNLGVLLLICAFAHTLLSATYSIDPDRSWAWWVEFSKVLVIGLLITMLVNTERRMRLALLVIVLSLGFEAVKQGWAQLVLNPGAANQNPHVVLGDNNGVALGMFMLAPLAGALVSTSTGLERRFHQFFMGGIIIRGLTTYSRGGLLAALVVALHATARSRHRLRMLLGIAMISGALLAVMPQSFWDRMGTITASEDERDASAEGRLYFWGLALEMARDHPFTGVGFNAFPEAYNLYDRSEGAYGYGRAVHSTWFGMLAENGYPGLLLLLGLIVYSFVTAGRMIRETSADPEFHRVNAMARALQGSLVAFVVGGSFLNGQYSELLWHLFCLTIALDGVLRRETARSAPPLREPAGVPVMA